MQILHVVNYLLWTCRKSDSCRIPHNALHARFEGKRNKGRPRLPGTSIPL